MGKNIFWMGFAACALLVVICFLPWVHINSVNQDLYALGNHQFPNGTSYGKPGYVIIFLSSLNLLLSFIKNTKVSILRLLIVGLLFAYCLRTFILFTGSLFDGEVEKLLPVYGLLLLPLLAIVGIIFSGKKFNVKKVEEEVGL